MDKETADVLDSIRKMLSKSSDGKRNKSDSPYAYVDTTLKTHASKSKSRKKKRKKQTTADDARRPPSSFSREETMERAISLPFIDSVLLVDTSLKVAREWSQKTSTSEDIPQLNAGKMSKIDSLIKKYPRFCEDMVFSRDISAYKNRSDIWLARIIEEAYDAAVSDCCKPVCQARTRRRFELELGAMDSFPHAVRRYIAQKYSMLDICPQICMELLLALDRVSEAMDRVSACRNVEENMLCSSGRVQLFSSFLSEEVDVDRLATFLHVRDVVQEACGIRFRDTYLQQAHHVEDVDVSSPSMYQVDQTSASLRSRHTFLSSSQSTNVNPYSDPDVIDIIDATKYCPVKLPFNFRLVYDAHMPETMLLAIDMRTVNVICQTLTPNCAPEIRQYLIRKCLFWTETLIHMKASIFRMLQYLQDVEAFDACQYEGIMADGLRVIPAAVIIWVVTTELSYYAPPAAKTSSIGMTEEEKMSMSTEQGISILHNFYENNCAKVNKADADVAAAELELSQINAKILKLEKKKKRIERKWKEFTPDLTLTGLHAIKAQELKGYDLNELAGVRTSILEAEGERSGAEATCRRLKKKRKELLSEIDSIWNNTVQGMSVKVTTNPTKRPVVLNAKGTSNVKWRDVVVMKIVNAVSGNYENCCEFLKKGFVNIRVTPVEDDKEVELELQRARKELMSNTEETTIGSEDVSFNGAESTTHHAVEGVDDSDWDVDIATQIKRLESEARKLAAIGRVTCVEDVDGATPTISGDVDMTEMRQQLASREAEAFIQNIITKHAIDSEQSGFPDSKPEMQLVIAADEAETLVKSIFADAIATICEVSKLPGKSTATTARQMETELVQDAVLESASDEIEYMQLNDVHTADKLSEHSAVEADEIDILDFKVYEYVSERTQEAVEEMCAAAIRSSLVHCLREWRYVTYQEYRLKEFRAAVHASKCRRALATLKQFSMDCYVMRYNSALILQCAMRQAIARAKVAKLKRAHEIQNEILAECDKSISNSKMARALRTWTKWKENRIFCRECKKRAFVHLVEPTFTNWRERCCQIRIAFAVRRYLAKRKVYIMRKRRVRLGDLAHGFERIYMSKVVHKMLAHWRLLRAVNVIFRLMYSATLKTKVLRSWLHWTSTTKLYVARRIKMATKIQSVVRMYIGKKKEFNFYVAKRGMTKLQCIARRRIAITVVSFVRKWHMSAIAVQRVVRGFTYRLKLRRLRIDDIHFSASNNKYERLLYYCEKYYNLTFQLDENGNTALHNASQSASKRCIKLLIRFHHDPTVVNPQGYSPLHLLILSSATHRDDVFEYMLRVGFDDEQLTPDGKNALLLAAENGRMRIANVCLQRGLNVNQVDSHGATSLQYACTNGYEPLVKSLLDYDADCNMQGYGGMYPLHDAMVSGNLNIVKMLLAKGAEVNSQESEGGTTPLMMACRNNLEDIVDVILLHEADISIQDYSQRTAAHHCVYSNSSRIANALRELDADFNAVDSEGNSPLHYAAQHGSAISLQEFLYAGSEPSLQNKYGNQPSHMAAQYNHVACLKVLVKYDEHIGRVNYSHQTPLGLAKFHLAYEAQKFLEDHFSKMDGPDVRNSVGDIWWDKELDMEVDGWRVVVDEANHRHFVNDSTGEISLDPPVLSSSKVMRVAECAQIPMRMRVKLQEEENTLNRHEYLKEYEETQKAIEEEARIYDAATAINKIIRMKLACMLAIRKRKAKERIDTLTRFFIRARDSVIKWKLLLRARKLTRVQALWRGYSMRCHFYYWDGSYEVLWYEYSKRKLARMVWNAWKSYKRNQVAMIFKLAANAPKLLHEWEPVLEAAGYPVRVNGVMEEYLYPRTRNIYFYRNIVTNAISFDKPKEWAQLDMADFKARSMYRELGYTPGELKLALKLQSLWRGHRVRTMYMFIVRATTICVNAETDYLEHPDSDRNLFNYTLFVHVVQNDYDRARPLYVEALRRMTFKGPDIAHVLYAYAIFSFVCHEQDFEEVLMLIERARVAEAKQYNYIRKQRHRAKELSGKGEGVPYEDIPVTAGKMFELANVGFFRYMCNMKDNADGYHNYAACRFLVYSDFPGTFDAFMGAFKSDPQNKRLRDNYNVMMKHFFGNNQDKIDTVALTRMQHLAEKDHAEKREREASLEQWKKRNAYARQIQKWYRHHHALKEFYVIVKKLRRRKKNTIRGGRGVR